MAFPPTSASHGMIDVAFTRADLRPADVAVVIDVLRATSTATQALAAGYRSVLCVESVESRSRCAGRGACSRASAAASARRASTRATRPARPRTAEATSWSWPPRTERRQSSLRRRTPRSSCSRACSTSTPWSPRWRAPTSRSSVRAPMARWRWRMSTSPGASARACGGGGDGCRARGGARRALLPDGAGRARAERRRRGAPGRRPGRRHRRLRRGVNPRRRRARVGGG